MKRPHRTHFGALVAAAAISIGALCAPSIAHAQSAEADRLFRQGLNLFEHSQYKAACDKFSASYAIDPAAGTLFNLASCHEKVEQWAAASKEFLELARRAAASGANDKAQQARDRAHAAEAHLPRLAIHGAREHGFDTVSVDGTAVAAAEWGTPVIVTAGDHVVEARGAGKPTAHLTVTAREATETPVDLGATSVEAPVPPPPTTAAVTPSTPGDTGASTQSSSSPWRTVGWITGGAGVVLIAGGAYFGAKTFSLKSEADKACNSADGTHACPSGNVSAAQSEHSHAETTAALSTVGLIVGAAALGTGAYLVLRRSSSSSTSGSLRLAPRVGRDGGGAMVVGEF